MHDVIVVRNLVILTVVSMHFDIYSTKYIDIKS